MAEQESLDLGESAAPRKRRRRRGSITVLPSGSVRVRIRDVLLPDGRKIELKKTIVEGDSLEWRKAEAYRRVRPALEKQALDLESGLAVYESAITLAELVTALRAARIGFKWNPRKDGSTWKRLRPLWNITLASIDAPRVSGLIARLEREGLSPAYQRSIYGLLRRILGKAVEGRYLARVPPFPRGMLPGEESSRRTDAGLEAAQKVAVFEAARQIDARTGGDLAARLAFQLDTGFRPLECCWVRIEDLQEDEAGQWWVRARRAKGSGLRKGQGIDRVAIAGVLAREILRRVDAMPPRARALGLIFPEGPLDRAVYRQRHVDEPGRREGKNWITDAEVAQLRKVSGVSGFFPYALRHTRMHELAAAGASEWQLMHFAAWRSLRMVKGYVGTISEPHPAMLQPSAPLPGVSPIKLILGNPGPSLEGSGEGARPLELAGVGGPVGGGGRGRAVGSALEAWAALEPEERDVMVSAGLAILDAAAEWASPAKAAAAFVRVRGLPACREGLEDLRVLQAAGALEGREGELAGLVLALASRTAVRSSAPGVKKAGEAPRKVSNLRAVGDAGGYRCT